MTKRRKRRIKNLSPSKARCDAVDDDIVAQLRRQRRQQQQQSNATISAVANRTPSELSLHKDPNVISSADQHRNIEYKSVGKFQYDPIRKRYFPKSIFASYGSDDPCTQRIRTQTPVAAGGKVVNANNMNIEEQQLLRRSGYVSDKELTMIVFRGICLSKILFNSGECPTSLTLQDKRKKKNFRDDVRDCYYPPIHCTERTSLLLTCSLEYCASSHRRNAIATMLSPLVIARRATIVPNMSTLDDIRKGTRTRFLHFPTNHNDIRSYSAWRVESQNAKQSSQWYSILHPFQRRGDRLHVMQPQQMPLSDSNCKLYLQPTVPTFDVLCNQNDARPTSMPHIATICNDAIFYRAPSTNATACSAWELERKSESLQYHGVRLANSPTRSTAISGITGNSVVAGCIVYDVHRDSHDFIIQNTSPSEQVRYAFEKDYFLRSLVNDFRFAHDRSLTVAFAYGGDAMGVSIQNIASDAFVAGSYRGGLHSEPLCLQFQPNSFNDNLLLGHRDGSISMLDIRSRDVLFAHNSGLSKPGVSSFGSAASIRPLKRDNNLVVAKGSFGTCRLLDIRKLSNNIDSSRHRHSTVFELSLPNHILHKTKSTRCTGLAVDPDESIAVAPFAGQNGDIHFAVWDICSTGRLLRTLNLNDSLGKRSSDTSGKNAAYCELSDVVTSGYEMIWFKTNLSISNTVAGAAPLMGGSIHHIKF